MIYERNAAVVIFSFISYLCMFVVVITDHLGIELLVFFVWKKESNTDASSTKEDMAIWQQLQCI